MRIIINESETYEVKLKEEISLKELMELVKKIEVLSNLKLQTSPTPSTPTSTVTVKNKVGRPKKRKVGRPMKIDVDTANLKCISCGSIRLHRKGFSRQGLRRVGCSNCGVSFTVTNEGNPVKKKRRKAMKWGSREEVLEVLKIHYFGTTQQKEAFAQKKNSTWDNIVKALHNLRIRFKIDPSEVGLSEFPTINNKKRKFLQPSQVSQPQFQRIPIPQPPLELHKQEQEEQEEQKQEQEPVQEPVQEEKETDEERRTRWWGR